MEAYKDNATFPGGNIDGVPNFTIEPKVSASYISVANMNGKFILGSEIIDATDIKTTDLKSAPRYMCNKEHDKRSMTIHIYPDFNKEEYLVKVWHHKKTWLGWFAYRTKYYYRLRAGGPIVSGHEVSSGSDLHIPTFGYRYLEIWNRGVGESQKCTFSF